jgi:hypothetical protein
MPEYFDFEVSLEGADPRVWRRLLIECGATFEDLHLAIQRACGWTNDHLYEFTDPKSRERIGGNPMIPEEEIGDVSAYETPLSRWFRPRVRRKFTYLYDFGDCWRHDLVLKGIVSLPEAFARKLIGGARAFPLEDCGGLYGYSQCLEAVRRRKANPTKSYSEEEDMYAAWVAEWDPDEFDLESTKTAFDLSKLKVAKPQRRRDRSRSAGKRRRASGEYGASGQA